jgi:sterol desaturase/sphingolipid hydroxylase (fatty acid hydroxylase superfamily)
MKTLVTFGVAPIEYSQIKNLEEGSADLILYGIPIVAVFTILEIWYSWYSDTSNYDAKESIGSLFVGLGNVTINFIFKVGLIYSSVYIYNLVPWRMALDWLTLIPCLLIFDLCSYWSHRVSHFSRFFWSTHVVHHSAEKYNLTVSFRISWIQHLKIVFFLPVAFLGFHPIIFFVVNQISVLFQFWQHTEYIGKLHPWIEKLIVTPSNHRVHHGSEKKYIDKNFAAIFILWDRIFGTYQEEEERPTYGLTTKIEKTIDPIYLNFHEYKDMIIDIKGASGYKKKLFYLFGSPAAVQRERLKQKKEVA